MNESMNDMRMQICTNYLHKGELTFMNSKQQDFKKTATLKLLLSNIQFASIKTKFILVDHKNCSTSDTVQE